MKSLICILLIFIGFYTRAQQTWSISGTVKDEKGQPVPGATAFLADTKEATATDVSGKFILDNLQPGVYQLVIKMLGFNVYTQSVIIQKTSPVFPVVLKESNTELKTVNITAISAEKRKEYLGLFIKYFIGESDNAGKCKLLNPEVLDFSFNKNTNDLEVTSEQFIIIENKALGYKVHYLLTAFNLNLNIHTLYYDGSLFLEELSGSKSQQAKWDENRQLVYEGSKWHFFKAAFDGRLREEGFWLYRFPTLQALGNLKSIDTGYLHPFDRTDSLFKKVDENIKSFNLGALKKDSTLLFVIYIKKHEPYEYALSGRHLRLPKLTMNGLPARYKGFNPDAGQTSVIFPLQDSMLIDKNGNTNPKNAIGYAGYWTWYMASGFLPPDYKIPVKDTGPVKRK